jgi:hypothetical protein
MVILQIQGIDFINTNHFIKTKSLLTSLQQAYIKIGIILKFSANPWNIYMKMILQFTNKTNKCILKI